MRAEELAEEPESVLHPACEPETRGTGVRQAAALQKALMRAPDEAEAEATTPAKHMITVTLRQDELLSSKMNILHATSPAHEACV